MPARKIGDWPFGPPGVDCRTCLREPCVCFRPGELMYFPMAFPTLVEGDSVAGPDFAYTIGEKRRPAPRKRRPQGRARRGPRDPD